MNKNHGKICVNEFRTFRKLWRLIKLQKLQISNHINSLVFWFLFAPIKQHRHFPLLFPTMRIKFPLKNRKIYVTEVNWLGRNKRIYRQTCLIVKRLLKLYFPIDIEVLPSPQKVHLYQIVKNWKLSLITKFFLFEEKQKVEIIEGYQKKKGSIFLLLRDGMLKKTLKW